MKHFLITATVILGTLQSNAGVDTTILSDSKVQLMLSQYKTNRDSIQNLNMSSPTENVIKMEIVWGSPGDTMHECRFVHLSKSQVIEITEAIECE